LNGFHHNGADKCMYSKFTKKKLVWLFVSM
jgi:hypothetical protein